MDKYICECCGGHINPRTMKYERNHPEEFEKLKENKDG